MNQEYLDKGFFVMRSLFDESELQDLKDVLQAFHRLWLQENQTFYKKKAINSAYLTSSKYLDDAKRRVLFEFIGSSKLMNVVDSVIPERPCFLNTQLFFDPFNPEQRNYWHRDPQYFMSIEEQQQALSGPNVIHCRLPLKKERGIELVPQSHRCWDTDEELNVRLETEGRKNHEDLSSGVAIELDAGDMLVFSANMIHRGLYGNDRFALDMIFFDPDPDIAVFVDEDCLPSEAFLRDMDDPAVFQNTLHLKAESGD